MYERCTKFGVRGCLESSPYGIDRGYEPIRLRSAHRESNLVVQESCDVIDPVEKEEEEAVLANLTFLILPIPPTLMRLSLHHPPHFLPSCGEAHRSRCIPCVSLSISPVCVLVCPSFCTREIMVAGNGAEAAMREPCDGTDTSCGVPQPSERFRHSLDKY